MKNIKELEAELSYDGFSNNSVDEAKIKTLKDVLGLIEHIVTGQHISPQIEELKKRISG